MALFLTETQDQSQGHLRLRNDDIVEAVHPLTHLDQEVALPVLAVNLGLIPRAPVLAPDRFQDQDQDQSQAHDPAQGLPTGPVEKVQRRGGLVFVLWLDAGIIVMHCIVV